MLQLAAVLQQHQIHSDAFGKRSSAQAATTLAAMLSQDSGERRADSVVHKIPGYRQSIIVICHSSVFLEGEKAIIEEVGWYKTQHLASAHSRVLRVDGGGFRIGRRGWWGVDGSSGWCRSDEDGA
jgi:hypothetical protein